MHPTANTNAADGANVEQFYEPHDANGFIVVRGAEGEKKHPKKNVHALEQFQQRSHEEHLLFSRIYESLAQPTSTQPSENSTHEIAAELANDASFRCSRKPGEAMPFTKEPAGAQNSELIKEEEEALQQRLRELRAEIASAGYNEPRYQAGQP